MKEKTIEAIIIGENIKYYRDLMNLTQAQLGTLAFGYSLEDKNASQGLISKFERGDQEPKASELARVAAVLKQDIKKFLDRVIIDVSDPKKIKPAKK